MEGMNGLGGATSVAGSATMILNDHQISAFASKGMIDPFEPRLVRVLENGQPVLSYGLSSYGYDLRLSPKEFLIFRHVPGTVVDPKAFNSKNLERTPLHEDESGKYFILHPGRLRRETLLRLLWIEVEKLRILP